MSGKCRAKSKRHGGPCGANAVRGKDLCYHHGGRSLSGPAHPAYRTGRYSKVLPTRMLDRYAEAAKDPELLSLRDEVTLIDTRLADVLTRVDTGESGRLWFQARDTWKDLKDAMAASDPVATRKGMADLEEMLGRGVSDWAAWAEVAKLLGARKALVESERKRLVEMQATMTAEQAMVFVSALTDAVKRHVSDRSALAAISDDLARLLSIPARAEFPHGGGRESGGVS